MKNINGGVEPTEHTECTQTKEGSDDYTWRDNYPTWNDFKKLFE
ncbi:hypothetical protein [Tenacibaculum sp. 1B UA]|nr:hypothetical protein [Tenacibaculum sp. 1B UA]